MKKLKIIKEHIELEMIEKRRVCWSTRNEKAYMLVLKEFTKFKPSKTNN